MNTSPSTDDNLDELAAYWCLRLHEQDCSPDEQEDFQRWIDQDPKHAYAYQSMLEVWKLSKHLNQR